jgi:hypothetical protein
VTACDWAITGTVERDRAAKAVKVLKRMHFLQYLFQALL